MGWSLCGPAGVLGRVRGWWGGLDDKTGPSAWGWAATKKSNPGLQAGHTLAPRALSQAISHVSASSCGAGVEAGGHHVALDAQHPSLGRPVPFAGPRLPGPPLPGDICLPGATGQAAPCPTGPTPTPGALPTRGLPGPAGRGGANTRESGQGGSWGGGGGPEGLRVRPGLPGQVGAPGVAPGEAPQLRFSSWALGAMPRPLLLALHSSPFINTKART